MPQPGASLTGDAKVVIYDHNMFNRPLETLETLQPFNFFVTHALDQKATVFVNDNPFQPSVISHFSLLGPVVSYKEKIKCCSTFYWMLHYVQKC
jgi:hypothetical protein